MIRLTVPIEVPVLLFTVIPVFSPWRVLAETAPRARTLFWLAWLMPVGDALAGPWLFCSAGELLLYDVPDVEPGTIGSVVGGVCDNALFGLAFITPVGDAFIGP